MNDVPIKPQTQAQRPWLAEVVSGPAGLAARRLLGAKVALLPISSTDNPQLAAGDLVLVRPAEGEPGSHIKIVGPPLARSGSLRAGLYHIAARHSIDPTYPPEAHSEAAAWAVAPGIDDGDLEDLTPLPFITIDNPDSRDLDQALHIERIPTGGFLVCYALADASYYVRPGSALFGEALRRGASFYLPDLTIPMLPHALSEDLVSLNQDQRRRALVFEMELDAVGKCIATRLVRARICSARKLSYQRVQRYYDDPGESGFGGSPFTMTCDLLREVGRLLVATARRRHVVDYNRTEVAVSLPVTPGARFRLISRERLEVERYNEQISLLCNVEGARFLRSARGLEHVQAVFRVHPAPTDKALRHLREQIETIITAHDLDRDLCWGWPEQSGPAEPLADYLARLPRTGGWKRITQAIERQALMANARSVFRKQPGRHFGIGAPVYARFSSPMREIVGIFTHKEAFEALQGVHTASETAADIEIRKRVLVAGNRAKQLQRQITKEANALVLDALFRSELELPEEQRLERRGTILGTKPTLLYVGLDDPPIEVKVYFRDIESQTGTRYCLDRHGVMLRPRPNRGQPMPRVGDAITLRVVEYHQARGRWLFDLGLEPGCAGIL